MVKSDEAPATAAVTLLLLKFLLLPRTCDLHCFTILGNDLRRALYMASVESSSTSVKQKALLGQEIKPSLLAGLQGAQPRYAR
jgi:hypothetical protein